MDLKVAGTAVDDGNESSKSATALKLCTDNYSSGKVSSYYIGWKQKEKIKDHYRSMKQKDRKMGKMFVIAKTLQILMGLFRVW
jgi:hypothetical protein